MGNVDDNSLHSSVQMFGVLVSINNLRLEMALCGFLFCLLFAVSGFLGLNGI